MLELVEAGEGPELIHLFGEGNAHKQIVKFARTVAEAFPGCEVITGPPSADNRSYRVDFSKIEHELPGFTSRWTAADGARELHDLFARIALTEEMYQFRAFTRLDQLKHLQATGQLDPNLFWTAR